MSNNIKGFLNSNRNKSSGKKMMNGMKNAKNRSARFAKNKYENFKKMSIWQIIWIIIIVIIIIIIIIYWAVNVSQNNKSNSSCCPVLVGKEINAFNLQKSASTFKVKSPEEGAGFTFSTWIYIQDWAFNFAAKKIL